MARTRWIFPADPRLPTNPDRLVRYCIYEIVEAHAPPQVDLSKTLKRSLLPSALVPMFTRWQRRYFTAASVCFFLSQGVSLSLLFMAPPLGRILSVVCFILQSPFLILGSSTLCTDIVLQLLKTFEFWFFTFANTSTSIVMGLYFGDLRALYLLPVWIGIQYNICIDAAVRGFKLALASLVVGIVYHTTTLVMISLQAIPGVKTFNVLDYGIHTLDGNDFLMNTISTVLYMFARSIFRRIEMLRRQSQRDKEHGIRFVRCVSYRRAVKLRPLKRAALTESPSPSSRAEDETPIPSRIRSPIHFVHLDRTFDSRQTLFCGSNLTTIRIPRWQQVFFHACGALGLTLTGLMFLVLNYVPNPPRITRALAIASPILTVSYCCISISLYHPGLLKTLCCTVDFAFMASQFLFAHVCAAFLFQWDDRVFVLLSSFFWVLLMLTVDAFTPAAREKIGFHLVFILPILVMSIVAHIMIAHEVTRTNSVWRLRDYTIFQLAVFGHKFELHVTPSFFNRVWMLVFWELRAVWRVLRATRYDLVMIHGAVDLDITHQRGRRSTVFDGPNSTILSTLSHASSDSHQER